MNRLEQLSENALMTRVAAIRRQLDELKPTSQRAGSANVVIKHVTSGNAYDMSVNLATNAVAIFEIDFIPVDPNIDYSSMVYNVTAQPLSTAVSYSTAFEWYQPEAHKHKWLFYIKNFNSVNLVMQWLVTFVVIGDGNFTVTRLQ